MLQFASCLLALSYSGCNQGSASESPVAANAKNSRTSSANKEALTILAFGDFGKESLDLVRTMEVMHRKFPDPDMVFLLGDNTYEETVTAENYRVFYDIVAKDSKAPHYAILGNHDYEHHNEAMMLELNARDPRWNMPSTYYFKRFEGVDFSLCCWFLDTTKIKDQQIAWLDASLTAEKASCTWTVVNGHHPGRIHATAEFTGGQRIDQYLQPVLDKHNVDLYLCGHHHNSQHLTNLPLKTHYFITGQLVDVYHVGASPAKGQLVWNSEAAPAFLQLTVKASQIEFSYHSGYDESVVMHSGILAK